MKALHEKFLDKLLWKILLYSEAELREKENKPPPEPASSVKLDAVVQLVDDVSENMTYFKERVSIIESLQNQLHWLFSLKIILVLQHKKVPVISFQMNIPQWSLWIWLTIYHALALTIWITICSFSVIVWLISLSLHQPQVQDSDSLQVVQYPGDLCHARQQPQVIGHLAQCSAQIHPILCESHPPS